MKELVCIEIIDVISKEVCSVFNVEVSEILSKRREDKICTPRHVVFYLSRTLRSVPFLKIGLIFERNHGTVMNGFRKVDDRMTVDARFDRQVQDLAELCRRKLAEKNL